MKNNRIYNFNAGPAALPLIVLEEIKDSFLNFNGTGMSITEISHRSKLFDDIINDAIARTKRLLKLDDKFHKITFFLSVSFDQTFLVGKGFERENTRFALQRKV